MPFQWCNDVDRCSGQPHTAGNKLHGERFARARGTEDRHICVFIDAGVEVIETDERVIIFIHTQQYAVGVAQLKADERIKAGGGGGKDIAAVFLKQCSIRGAQR